MKSKQIVFLFTISSLAFGLSLLFLTYRITRIAPWQLEQLKYPNPEIAFLESLFYTVGSFGLLVYLAASEHNILHFIFGFLGVISAWLTIQIIYSQEYAVRYYYDDQPHWTEFLYQGFCIASCYQTSDTSINSTALRQRVVTHGILAYFLSVSIIAMIFGLIGNLL
jgi:uncharacterized membrane protein